MNKIIDGNYKTLSDKTQDNLQIELPIYSKNTINQPAWQRILLLIILAYEGAGALVGGIFLVIEPDGRLMDMPVEIMHGFFRDFLIPGLILAGLGLLNSAAFITVLLRNRFDWLLSGFGLGGLFIWFVVEIIILHELHWLHGMWGIPVIIGCLLTLPMVLPHLNTRQSSHGL